MTILITRDWSRDHGLHNHQGHHLLAIVEDVFIACWVQWTRIRSLQNQYGMIVMIMVMMVWYHRNHRYRRHSPRDVAMMIMMIMLLRMMHYYRVCHGWIMIVIDDIQLITMMISLISVRLYDTNTRSSTSGGSHHHRYLHHTRRRNEQSATERTGNDTILNEMNDGLMHSDKARKQRAAGRNLNGNHNHPHHIIPIDHTST